MLRNLMASATVALAAGSWAVSVQAAQVDDLLDALGVPQIVEIMRAEGIEYGDTLAADMVPGGSTPGWEATVERIYDDKRMLATVREQFSAEFGETDIDPLLAFFTSDVGQQVVNLELSARSAMREQEIEDAARAAFRDLEGTQSKTLAMISEFVDTNDLVDANLVGALNANYMFYLGLVDGGALEMSEQDILTEVWSSRKKPARIHANGSMRFS